MIRNARNKRTRGFTLLELLVVMTIIGIIITFILIAAHDGIRRAEEKATLSLITKLEIGLSERLEALLIRRSDIYQSHRDIAAIYNASLPPTNLVVSPVGVGVSAITADQRAQVIAQFDLVKAEMPDVFFVQNNTHYPINFAAVDYPPGSGNFAVPLGAILGTNATGNFGATWAAMSGIYKNLGYLPSGYDGLDNNGNGLIDDLTEGIGPDPFVDDPDGFKQQIRLSALIARRLGNHTHNTARSEMLYALLVEGQGPLGSVFAADEFTAREVKDTDRDGLPEFVDAWGQPIQFYRWPIYYNGDYSAGGGTAVASYVQKGMLPYGGAFEPRQTDPLDAGQSLVAPAWFSTSNQSLNAMASFTAGATYSSGAAAFMTYFHSLLDPNYPAPPNQAGFLWDRSGFYARRAYYTRPLIISSGPDKELGVAQLAFGYGSLYAPSDGSGAAVPLNALTLIAIENQAAAIDPNRVGPFGSQERFPGTNQTSAGLRISGQDDVSNQGLASPGGGVR